MLNAATVSRWGGQRRRWAGVVLLVGAALFTTVGCEEPPSAGSPRVLVLTAASANEVLTEIARDYQTATGTQVVVSAGASNALATQILAGAPADLFLAASQPWADKLQREGLVREARPLLTNELVLIVPRGNPAGIAAPADLVAANETRLALAGETVPAGLYAEQALRALNLYDELLQRKRIVRGQDVRGTLSFVERGEADAGIVYATDAALSDRVEIVFRFDPATHDAIIYPLVLLNQAGPAAERFYAHLFSPEAAAVFERHGFRRVRVRVRE